MPVSSGEEGAGRNPAYACCTFRGSIVALDAATGPPDLEDLHHPRCAAAHQNRIGRGALGSRRRRRVELAHHRPQTPRALCGTGDAYTEPAAKNSDAVMSMDLASGKIQWVVQDTENDAWLGGCDADKPVGNCPEKLGPDHDFASPPVLKVLPNGRRILVVGQKSGNVWAHDPDRNGAVVWRTALVSDTTKFGGKIIWGGAVDDQNGYFGLGSGGIAAVAIKDGERNGSMRRPLPVMAKHVGHDGPLTAIPGVVFSGGWDGVLRAISSTDGHVMWEYNTVRDFETVNSIAAKGGSMGAAGPTVAGGTLFVNSGYIGVKNGLPGNVLLAFSAQ